jgi:hypothetical protein
MATDWYREHEITCRYRQPDIPPLRCSLASGRSSTLEWHLCRGPIPATKSLVAFAWYAAPTISLRTYSGSSRVISYTPSSLRFG